MHNALNPATLHQGQVKLSLPNPSAEWGKPKREAVPFGK